jgi:hypothetical protein
MIVVRLMGGLGNQMFQYACGRSLAIRHNVNLKLDLTSLANDHNGRTFQLDRFRTSYRVAKQRSIQRLKWRPRPLVKRVIWRFFGKHYPLVQAGSWVREDLSLSPERLLHAIPTPCYLDGYWQSEEYFAEIADLIRNEFKISKPLSLEAQKNKKIIHAEACPVSLHIRRGDYLSNIRTYKKFGVLDIDYYQNSIAYLKSHLGSFSLFVFTDDPEWVSDKFRVSASFTIISNFNPPHEDLDLISLCRHHIIANSSFSWWGAWLNHNPNKIIIAPSKWFSDPAENANSQRIIPKNWIII